jgi:hypothetical protein
MAELKTKPTEITVESFLDKITNERDDRITHRYDRREFKLFIQFFEI